MAFNRDYSAELARFVEATGIKSVIAQTFEFDQAVEAIEVLEKQNVVGKLVVGTFLGDILQCIAGGCWTGVADLWEA